MKQIILLALLSIFSLPAMAGSFYLGGGIYYTAVDEDFNGNNFDESDSTLGINLGYKFNNFIGLEAGYYDLGSYSRQWGNSQELSLDTDAVTLGAVGILPLSVLDLYAKVGAAYLDTEVNAIGLVYGNGSDSTTEAYGGVGGNLNLGSHVDLYLEYIVFDGDIAVDNIGLGIRAEF